MNKKAQKDPKFENKISTIPVSNLNKILGTMLLLARIHVLVILMTEVFNKIRTCRQDKSDLAWLKLGWDARVSI